MVKSTAAASRIEMMNFLTNVPMNTGSSGELRRIARAAWGSNAVLVARFRRTQR